MTSQGVLELINCIERYDWRKGVQFDSYASIRVRGSIIDYIRKKDWVPRDTRKRAKCLRRNIRGWNELAAAGDAELAQSLGISRRKFAAYATLR